MDGGSHSGEAYFDVILSLRAQGIIMVHSYSGFKALQIWTWGFESGGEYHYDVQ